MSIQDDIEYIRESGVMPWPKWEVEWLNLEVEHPSKLTVNHILALAIWWQHRVPKEWRITHGYHSILLYKYCEKANLWKTVTPIHFKPEHSMSAAAAILTTIRCMVGEIKGDKACQYKT